MTARSHYDQTSLWTRPSREHALRISDLFRVDKRYLRSTHLERDFADIAALKHYVPTPTMLATFSRILDGLRPSSSHRAWRITGDYGTGKSSFALVLAHLLRDPAAEGVREIAQRLDVSTLDHIGSGMIPVLVTGAREPLIPAVARAVGRTMDSLPMRRRAGSLSRDLSDRAAAITDSGNANELVDLVDSLCHYISRQRRGVLLVLDELGKFLEYAALHPRSEDVYVLQRLAEVAARSGNRPLVLIGLLHQGFNVYADRLPSSARVEWEKVAGRYEEIAFDHPLVDVAELVSGALNLDDKVVPRQVARAANVVHEVTKSTGWYGPSEWGAHRLCPYPVHPTLLPVLVRFFGRYGQHERSLFSFLLSSEPFGLQRFSSQPAAGSVWYRISDFYDYVRAAFGHRLSGSSYGSHWLRLVGTLDHATTAGLIPLQIRLLKTVAMLNVLESEDLLATEPVLAAAMSPANTPDEVHEALASLRSRGLLFDRGAVGFRLWPTTSVNLEAAFQRALRSLAPIDAVAPRIRQYLDEVPVIARRHYIQTGTLRHFQVRYCQAAALLDTARLPIEADGVVIVVLADNNTERDAALADAVLPEIASHPEVIVGIPPALEGIDAELQDCEGWQWVADNTPELAEDPYASAEVTRQVVESKRALRSRIDDCLEIRRGSDAVVWRRAASAVHMPARGGLAALLSNICGELYSQAPQIRNELLNRRNLSSAAAAARLRLIERMFGSADQVMLGIDPEKSPPEKSMYLSVLREGRVHRYERSRWVLNDPPRDDDPLNLRPSLVHAFDLLSRADGGRVAASQIFEELQQRPYGVRMGMAPLLLAIVMAAHAHELAVYEEGTFLARFGAFDFLRLIKQPSTFDLQLCRVSGVRADVFAQLVQAFLDGHVSDRRPELLDVVRQLSMFAAALTEYTRRHTNLDATTRKVRDALLVAREPGTLIFRDLPIACGLRPFTDDQPPDRSRARLFAAALRLAMEELRANYPRLLERIRDHVAQQLVERASLMDRAFLARRASQVLLAAREPRLQGFARAVADASLSPDAWAERIGSYVVAKPPSRWTEEDEVRAIDEIGLLSAAFCRVEATAFSGQADYPDLSAVRIALTPADGSEASRIVRVRPEDEASVLELVRRLELVLGQATGADLQMAALARVLTNCLAPSALVQ